MLLKHLQKLSIFKRPIFFFNTSSDHSNHLKIRSPYSNEVVYETHYLQLSEAQTLLKQTNAAQRDWSQVSLELRIESIQKVLQYFYTNFEKIAKMITQQMGKPITQSRNEIKGIAFYDLSLYNL